jgi:GNAT superfamily N-acetyltransferase
MFFSKKIGQLAGTAEGAILQMVETIMEIQYKKRSNSFVNIFLFTALVIIYKPLANAFVTMERRWQPGAALVVARVGYNIQNHRRNIRPVPFSFSTLIVQKPRIVSWTACHLFFRTSQEPSKVSQRALRELSSSKGGNVLPYNCTENSVVIRKVQSADIPQLVDMVLNEYGTLYQTTEATLSNPLRFSKYLWGLYEQWSLKLLVDLSTRSKIVGVENDHTVVVCERDQKILGIIEVSQQPVIWERNPPPYPQSLTYKRWLLGKNRHQPLQGWITNLLVVPEHRGQGLSKLLVASCEGLAKSWGCQSIHLHCDASLDGRVAQRLYQNLGYRPLSNTSSFTGWTPNSLGAWNMQSGIFLIDGVPLLYLYKELESESD